MIRSARFLSAARVVTLALGAILGGAPTVLARPFTADDLVGLRRISAPTLSADGRLVAYVVRDTELADNRGHTDLYVAAVAGGSPRRLTQGKASSHDPRWSPAGDALYYLAPHDGLTQVYRVAVKGGAPQLVTSLPVDVENFIVSPKGDRLALALGVFRDCESLQCTHDRLAASAAAKPKARLYSELLVRHWDTWADGRRNVLYTIALDPHGTATGEPVAISAALDGDVPSKPFGDETEFSFSPDGRSLVYSVRVAGREEAWSTNFDVYQSPVNGGPAVNLTANNKAWDTEPRFSPDGRTLVYRAMDRAGFEADRFHLVLRDVATGSTRTLAGDWDRSVSALRWSGDGKSLIVQVQDVGQQALYRVDVAIGRPVRLTDAGTVHGFDVGPQGVVMTLNSLGAPDDLYALAPGAAPRRLTDVNHDALKDVEFGAAEQFSFAGANGDTVYGYVIKPPGLVPGSKAPVAFVIHGGPQGSFANAWSYRWNPQVLAGAGYAAVFIDFHGSTGYGQAFTDAISRDWGGKPLEDLQKGLAAAEQKFPWLDGGRACALGASYGGYMINWIAGNWPDRFRCLVNHDGIFDSRAMYYSTEELWFEEWDHGGPYYENPDAYEKVSPSRFVDRWKTPMLVIHGEQDFRVPLAQGLSTFTALQRRGIESKLLVFPDENHWVLKPGNSLIWHRTVLDWLDGHLKH